MPKISSEKKREYNKKYREKQKEIKETSEPEIEVEKIHVMQEQPKADIQEQPDEEQYSIDKETMNYLLECIQKDKTVEETKAPSEPEQKKSEPNFFFHTMKQAMIQQLAVTVPLIALKLLVDGAKSSLPLKIQNIIQQSQEQPKPSLAESHVRVVNLE